MIRIDHIFSHLVVYWWRSQWCFDSQSKKKNLKMTVVVTTVAMTIVMIATLVKNKKEVEMVRHKQTSEATSGYVVSVESFVISGFWWFLGRLARRVATF